MAARALRGLTSISKPQIRHLAGGLDDQAGKNIDQCRFSGAVGAKQAEQLAVTDRKIDASKGLLAGLAAPRIVHLVQRTEINGGRRTQAGGDPVPLTVVAVGGALRPVQWRHGHPNPIDI